jgi:hypothetical protein
MSVVFQRLAQVRARHSRRRRRWIRGLATLGAAALIIAASQLATPMLHGRPVASWLERSVPLLSPGASSVTEKARGQVQIVEPTTGIIRVSSGFFGLMSVELVVTPETLIVVGDKEGGFGDIRDGSHVEVAYEAGPGPLRATRVEVPVVQAR